MLRKRGFDSLLALQQSTKGVMVCLYASSDILNRNEWTDADTGNQKQIVTFRGTAMTGSPCSHLSCTLRAELVRNAAVDEVWSHPPQRHLVDLTHATLFNLIHRDQVLLLELGRENPYHRRQRAQDGPEENNGREGTSEGRDRPTLFCVQLHKLRGANLFLATSSSTQTNSRSGRIYLRDCWWVFGVPGDIHAKVTLALHGETIAVKRQAQQKAGQRARVAIANKNTLQTWTEHSGRHVISVTSRNTCLRGP